MKDEYLEAWTEDDPQKVDPVVEAVKAARKADADAFADAFKNDRFEEEKKSGESKDSKADEEEPDSI